MPYPNAPARILLPLLLCLAAACGSDGDGGTGPVGPGEPGLPAVPVELRVLGLGAVNERYTSELSVRGGWAYTGTWSRRLGVNTGNAIKIWDVAGEVPVLRDSLIVSSASTLGDVQISPDGELLVVATEFQPGSIVLYGLDDPARPRQIARFSSESTRPGVHTAKLAEVDDRLYAFLSVDPTFSNERVPARLVIVDLADPTAPREVAVLTIGTPYMHDVFVRDGILFTALWNAGLTLWDLGGAGRGGSPESPVRLGTVQTVGGAVHNVWWYHDTEGGKRFAFVGEEQPPVALSSSAGDIHVVDVSDFDDPREVAFYHLPAAGTHNFSVDEEMGVLYAAYYNAGVRALDVAGDLSTCTVEQKDVRGRCDLWLMGREVGHGLGSGGAYVWGVQWSGDRLYASDMLAGLYLLDISPLRP